MKKADLIKNNLRAFKALMVRANWLALKSGNRFDIYFREGRFFLHESPAGSSEYLYSDDESSPAVYLWGSEYSNFDGNAPAEQGAFKLHVDEIIAEINSAREEE